RCRNSPCSALRTTAMFPVCAESSPLVAASASAAGAEPLAPRDPLRLRVGRQLAVAPPRGCRPLLAAALALASGLWAALLCAAGPRAGGGPAPAAGPQAAPEGSRGPGAGGRGGARIGGGVPSVEQLYEMARGVHRDLDERMLGYTRQFSGEVGQSEEADAVAQKLGWSGTSPALGSANSSYVAGNISEIEGMLSDLNVSMSEGISEMRSLEIMACLADSWQVISNLGSIIVNIQSLTQTCKVTDTYETRTTCASLVGLNLALWGYLGCNICNIMSSCPGVFNVEATCALGPVGIFASSAGTVNGAATMAGNCNQGLKPVEKTEEENETLAELAIGGGRRLRAAGGPKPVLPDWIGEAPASADDGAPEGTALGRYAEQLAAQSRAMAERGESPPVESVTVEGRVLSIPAGASQPEVDAIVEAEARRTAVAPAPAPLSSSQKWAIAACVFDTQTMAARFIQAAAFMGFAILDCRKEVFDEFGVGMKQKCVIDIGVMTASLAIASSMISLDIMNCPHTLEYMPNNLCATGILQIISSVSYFAVAFASIADACFGLDPNHPEPNQTRGR
ncbi:unnamed protein product, partial [Prorocentrum cordatum]